MSQIAEDTHEEPPSWHKTTWGRSLPLSKYVLASQQAPTVPVSCRYDIAWTLLVEKPITSVFPSYQLTDGTVFGILKFDIPAVFRFARLMGCRGCSQRTPMELRSFPSRSPHEPGDTWHRAGRAAGHGDSTRKAQGEQRS